MTTWLAWMLEHWIPITPSKIQSPGSDYWIGIGQGWFLLVSDTCPGFLSQCRPHISIRAYTQKTQWNKQQKRCIFIMWPLMHAWRSDSKVDHVLFGKAMETSRQLLLHAQTIIFCKTHSRKDKETKLWKHNTTATAISIKKSDFCLTSEQCWPCSWDYF